MTGEREEALARPLALRERRAVWRHTVIFIFAGNTKVFGKNVDIAWSRATILLKYSEEQLKLVYFKVENLTRRSEHG